MPDCTADGWVDSETNKLVCTTHGGLILLGRAVREALAADDTGGETSASKREPKASSFLAAPQQLPRWRPDGAKGGR